MVPPAAPYHCWNSAFVYASPSQAMRLSWTDTADETFRPTASATADDAVESTPPATAATFACIGSLVDVIADAMP